MICKGHSLLDHNKKPDNELYLPVNYCVMQAIPVTDLITEDALGEA